MLECLNALKNVLRQFRCFVSYIEYTFIDSSQITSLSCDLLAEQLYLRFNRVARISIDSYSNVSSRPHVTGYT